MEKVGDILADLRPIHAPMIARCRSDLLLGSASSDRPLLKDVPQLVFMISSESVEKACSEVGEYSDEMMVGEFDRFFRAQPAICDFVVESTHESGQKVQELSLFLSYMIFKAVEMDTAGSVTKVSPETIEAGYRETESWMERLSQADATELHASIAASLQHDTEPYLLQYVISELNEPMDDGTELNEEAKGEVFFVAKTVIESLKSQSKGRIIEVD